MTDDANNRVTDDEFWTYAQYPSPAIHVKSVCNEVAHNQPYPLPRDELQAVSPQAARVPFYPTSNLIGWNTTDRDATHSSWCSTYQRLGWSYNAIPAHSETAFLVSLGSVIWVSERLRTIAGLRTRALSELTKTTQGSPIQAYALAPEDLALCEDHRPPPANVAANRMKGSYLGHFRLESRYSIDDRVSSPAFAFGFRIRRYCRFRQMLNNGYEYHADSIFQPWLKVSRTGQYLPMTSAQVLGMNRSYEFGSQPQLNVARFATHAISNRCNLLLYP